jgi:hypothetical protein
LITLNQMTQLGRALLDAELSTKHLEAQLKDAKEHERLLREETVPSAMAELGVESITLDTGEKLTVTQEVYAQISSEKKLDAYKWLDDKGFGGLIKTAVEISFGKEDREKAGVLFEQLRANGYAPDLDMSIHASTLKSFIKERLANGEEFPLDLFGARAIFVAKIKATK